MVTARMTKRYEQKFKLSSSDCQKNKNKNSSPPFPQNITKNFLVRIYYLLESISFLAPLSTKYTILLAYEFNCKVMKLMY